MQRRSLRLTRRAIRAGAILTMLCGAAAAHAVPLIPGGNVFLPGTTSAARPELAGSIIRDVNMPFVIKNPSGTVIASGTLKDRVVRETVSGRLDFYVQVTSDPSSVAKLTTILRTDYSPSTTDVDWRSDGLGSLAPTSASRSATAHIVSFSFSSPNSQVFPGGTSRLTFIKTNATDYVVNGITLIQATFPTGAPGGSVRLITANPSPATSANTYHFYQLLNPDIAAGPVGRLAQGQRLTPSRGNPTSPQKTFVDGDGSVRIVDDTQIGSLKLLPNLALAVDPAPDARTAFSMGMDFLKQTELLPAVQIGSLQPGDAITLAAAGAGKPGDKPAGKDVLRTVHFFHEIDGLRSVGPLSLLSVDVSAKGPVGLTRTIRPISMATTPVAWKSFDAASNEFRAQLNSALIGLLRSDPNLTYRLVSTDLIYFEQGARFVQPAYRFRVQFTSGFGPLNGQTFIIPAATNTPEAVNNTPINENQASEPSPTRTAAVSIMSPHHATGSAHLDYGVYVVRGDNRFLQDAWGFHTALDAGNAIGSFLGFESVHFNQYFWDHPWLWEADPADGVADLSASFVGQNQVVLYEGHGAPWLVTTLGSGGDLIDYRTLPGYGGNNGSNGKTAYIVWHTCDSIPAPGDPYSNYYQSPAGPFDIWFNVFRGLRGTYGARTTVDIYDNAGPAFALMTGLGVPNLNAWLNAESNAVTGHAGGWDYGTAVILTGHENDKIYNNAPGPNPGSLTMYWQHP